MNEEISQNKKQQLSLFSYNFIKDNIFNNSKTSA